MADNRALAVYGIYDSAQAGYRIYSAGAWSSELLTPSACYNVHWVVMAECPTRLEIIALLICDSGDIYCLRFDEGTQQWIVEWSVNVGTTVVAYRCAYVAYEQLTGRAMVVYPNPADTTQILYTIWDGSTWSTPATVPITNTTGNICFVKLASKPGSNEIALVYCDDLYYLNAIIWDGSLWGNELLLETSLTDYAEQCFDAEYTRSASPYLMVTWSESKVAEIQYRTWDGTAWSLENYTVTSNDQYWHTLKAQEGTDYLCIGYIDTKGEACVQVWDGTAWSGETVLDTKAETTSDRCIDVLWLPDGTCLCCWGDGATISYSIYSAGTWSTATVITGSDDAPVVQLRLNYDGLVHLIWYDSGTGIIGYFSYSAGTWSALVTFTASPSTTLSPYNEPFWITPCRPIIPLSDVVDLAEVFAVSLVYVKNLADVVDLAEVFSVSKVISEELLDTLNLAEVFTKNYLGYRGLLDVTKLSEVFTRIVSYNKYFTDVTALTEAFVKNYLGYRSFAEELSLAEVFTYSIVFARYLADVLNLTEAFAKTYYGVRPLSDIVELSEVFAKYYLGYREFAEEVNLSEWFLRGLVKLITLADVTYLSEVFAKYFIKAVYLSDIFYVAGIGGGAGAYVTFEVPITETLYVDDIAFTVVKLIYELLSDALSLTEVFNRYYLGYREFEEVLSLIETFTKYYLGYRAFAEELSLAEVFARYFVYARYFAEAITLGEVFAKYYLGYREFHEVIPLIEVFSKIYYGLRTFAEGVSLAEVFTYTMYIARILSDVITLTEAFTKIGSYVRPLFDVVALAEVFSKIYYGLRTFAEELSLAEYFQRIRIVPEFLSDVLSLTDLGLRKEQTKFLTDTIPLVEHFAKGITKALIDAVTLSEYFLAGKYYVKLLSDIVKLTEQFTSAIIQTVIAEVSGVDVITGKFIYIPQAKIRFWKKLI